MIGYLDDMPAVEEPSGSALAADLSVGDSTISVDWDVDFNANGGLLQVGNTVLAYVAADNNTITLAAPSPIAALADDTPMVAALNAKGEPESEWTVYFRFDPNEAETLPAEVDSALAKWIRGDEGGLPIEVVSTEDGRGYRMLSFAGRSGQLGGGAVWNPHSSRLMAAASIPSSSSTYTQITAWTDVESDTVTGDSGFRIVEPGFYIGVGQVAFAPNSTGRRAGRVLVNGAPISLLSLPADDTGANSFVPLSMAQRLAEDDVVTVEVTQTSGAGLALATGAGRSIFTLFRASV